MRFQTVENGKGDKDRTQDKKKFDKNFDRIFRKISQKQKNANSLREKS
jgi:flagellar hook-basal body complex protein FliE